jgi:TonB family protein
VAATALNVRAEPSTGSEILTTLRRNARVTLIEESNGWYHVKLASGEAGWVSAQYISRGGAPPAAPVRRKGCPADADYAIEKAPVPSFSDQGGHGLVIIEATVNAKGEVTHTRIMSNSTGDPSLGDLAASEIRSAKFIAPIQDCAPQPFIFTYKRAF